MNDYNALYAIWKEKCTQDEDLVRELAEIAGNEEEILDRFYQSLAFGTGGLRGVLGAGTNRLNIYTVGAATQGLADYLNEDFTSPSVAIGYDSRNKSALLAERAACVLAANGIKAYLFKELIPTPIVAWAVRRLSCSSGIVITASHNPAKYNGYKCYDPRGYQMTDEAADKTLAYINRIDIFDDVKCVSLADGLASGMIEYIEDSLLDEYYAAVAARQINPGICKDSGLKLIYAPLHGSGNKPVRRIFKDIGLDDVTVVASQELPDGNFPTCPYPNPEIKQAFEEALKLTETVKADILLATDPDCDRVGIAVLDNGEYQLLTGNEVGCLLIEYILSCKKAKGTLAEKPVIVKTIVSSELATVIAKSYGAEMFDLLTGFKYIGELITQMEADGEADRFELGFEESYGYLSGLHTRDKDAVNASMLIAEMAAYYKKQGKTLVEVLNGLYAKHGYYLNSLFNYYVEGADGMQKMNAMLDLLRTNTPATVDGKTVTNVTDYKACTDKDIATGEVRKTTLPVSNVIALSVGTDKLIVRPSGTEPKLKIYASVSAADAQTAKMSTEQYRTDLEALLGLA
ncbi:MAG: phospho-sugar mutase [Clostridia bacterium]|nr:phospho-sugar mutase [Clostridia bacterium]